MIDRRKFYDSVRASLFSGKLNTGQVSGMESVLLEWDRRELTDKRQLAYILATIFHEVAKTMQPIEEYEKGAKKRYGNKIKYDGSAYTQPDKLYYGRGLVQSTWYENYQTLTTLAKKQGKPWDFLNQPELLLQLEPSIWATFEGMLKGIYTGVKLSTYFSDTREDWLNARRIINVLDKAELIRSYAYKFYKALI